MKSSISKALTIETNKIIEYKVFGIQDNRNVNADKEMKFEIFDDSAIREYVFVNSGKGVYDVLFGENEILTVKMLKRCLLNISKWQTWKWYFFRSRSGIIKPS